FGKDELGEHLLIDPSLGMAVVQADLGGSNDTFPRCVFVEKALVVRAMTEFFESGQRATDLSWADPFELCERAGIPKETS
ncbi:MAG TPA: hypothetical protein VKE98_16345, partial [Gemmataceae bacterium]|nr:hypothetical protein [Gemmataceae bacterium]